MSHTHAHPHAHTPEQQDSPDAWHTHYTDEPAPQHAHGENIAAGQVFIFGAAGFVILVAVIIAVIAYYTWYMTSLKVKLVEQGPFATAAPMNGAAEEARSRMPSNSDSQWAPVDASKGIYQTTLSKAMEKVVAKYQSAGSK